MTQPLLLSLALALLPIGKLMAASSSELGSAKAATKPNIVFILADDLGYGDVHCLNPDRCKIATPHMDKLAEQGMTFTDAHSTSAVCTPSRYSILTGRYNWRSRLQSSVLDGFSPPLIPQGRFTVADLMKQSGYATACIGKWHLGLAYGSSESGREFSKPISSGPTMLGFDYFFGIAASLDMPPFAFIENDHFTQVPSVTKKWGRAGIAAPDFEAVNVLPMLTRKAVEIIATNAAKKRPFFLYLPLTSPHTPLVPTKHWRGKSSLGDYGDFVMETDWAIGEVLAALEKSGVVSNTLVLLTSDNGVAPYVGVGPDQLKWLKAQGHGTLPPYKQLEAMGHYSSYAFRGHKSDIWDGGHRVPLLVRWPGKIQPGSTNCHLVSLVDFMATCAEIADFTLPANAGEDSVSFLPLLLGSTTNSLHEAVVYHSINGSFAIQKGRWKLELCPGSGGWGEPSPGSPAERLLPPVQLYDMIADVGEQTNESATHPELVAQLTELLEKYVADGRSTPGVTQSNDAFVDIWKQPPPTPSQDSPKQRSNRKGNTATIVYKRASERELKLYVDKPPNWQATDRRPAMVFYFGGGWVAGTPTQFLKQSEYLATRGMVGIRVEYRTIPQGDEGPPTVCCEDAKSAMRYVRAHATELGINPNRIGAAGGSAGGHLAAFTALVPGIDDSRDDISVSCKPDALLLFNPVFDNGPGQYGHDRVGALYMQYSPAHHVTGVAPPTIVFLGSKDHFVPVSVVKNFVSDMKKAGVRCDIDIYPGVDHGFFNNEPYYSRTLVEADKFLASLGWIQGPPTLKQPTSPQVLSSASARF